MTCTVLLAVFTLGSCNGLAGNDEMDRYFQRSDSITLSAGDAKQVNAVTHTINPWPRNVGDRRIVAQATKTRGAIVRYLAVPNHKFDPLPRYHALTVGIPMGSAGAAAAAVDAGATVNHGLGIGTVVNVGR